MAFSKAPNKIEVEKMIRSQLNKNPDLKYYVTDELEEIINPLIEAVSYAISKSITETERKHERELRNSQYF